MVEHARRHRAVSVSLLAPRPTTCGALDVDQLVRCDPKDPRPKPTPRSATSSSDRQARSNAAAVTSSASVAEPVRRWIDLTTSGPWRRNNVANASWSPLRAAATRRSSSWSPPGAPLPLRRRTRQFVRSPSRLGATSGRVSTGRVSTGRVSTGRVSTGRVSTGRVSTGRVSTGRVSTGRVSTGRVSTGRVSTGRVSTGRVSTGRVSTGRVSTGRVSTTGGSPSGKTTPAARDRATISPAPSVAITA